MAELEKQRQKLWKVGHLTEMTVTAALRNTIVCCDAIVIGAL